MQVTADSQNSSHKSRFNYKLVGFAFVLIAILYFSISALLPEKAEVQRIYCYFAKEIVNDSLPRHECTLLKIITPDLAVINWSAIERLDVDIECSDDISLLGDCDASTYHFTKFPLRTFCKDITSCDVEGYICGAYFIDYKNDTIYKEVYEDGMFTEPNVESKEALMKKLNDCGEKDG